jgi:hypothetical protein
MLRSLLSLSGFLADVSLELAKMSRTRTFAVGGLSFDYSHRAVHLCKLPINTAGVPYQVVSMVIGGSKYVGSSTKLSAIFLTQVDLC